MNWWRRLVGRKEQEDYLDRELRYHTEERIADLRRSGLSEEEARRRVRLEFGGMEQVKEECRDARGARWIEHLYQDLRYTVRMMRKNTAFTVLVVSILALGIGATTVVFSIVDAVLLRPSPYPSAERLMRIEESTTSRALWSVPVKD